MYDLNLNIFTKYKIIPFIFFVFFINTTIYSNSMFTSLSIEESKLKIEEGFIIVDVREESEFNESRIPNSHLIPLNTISKELLVSKFGQNADIIIHCSCIAYAVVGIKDANMRDEIWICLEGL